MTVQNIDSVVNYIGDGVTTVYPYSYRVLEEKNVFVLVNDVLLITGYTVFANPDQEIDPGGTVTFDLPPRDGDRIVLYRFIEQTQEIDYTAFDPFPAETHELGLDKLTLLVQQGSTLVRQAIHFEINEDPLFVNSLLTPVEERRDKYMFFNTNGQLVMWYSQLFCESIYTLILSL